MKIQIRSTRHTLWLVVIFMASLSGCAGLGVPRESGLYAVQGNQLQRLDGDKKWEMETWGKRSGFNPDVTFMIRSPQLATSTDLRNQIYLRRVSWVRSEINQEGEIQPVGGNKWATTRIPELAVPVKLVQHQENSEVVHVVPLVKLDRGLYTLQFAGNSGRQANARVGVQWSQADRRAYAAANCVDHYPGSAVDYRLCTDQRLAFANKWLKVHLVQPEVRNTAEHQRELVVKGVVVNTSKLSRKVPMLEAQLVNDAGVVVRRWHFAVPTEELQPGASTAFKSELTNPPPSINNIHVTIASGHPQPESLAASP